MPIVRWRCRQWLYHIRAPCALLRASHTHISDSPALKPQSITNSLVQLRYEHSLTPRIDLWACLGNAHVLTLNLGCLGTDVGATPHWDRPGSVMGWLPCLRPFPLTHTCRTPFPWDLAAAFKRLHKFGQECPSRLELWCIPYRYFCLFTPTFQTKLVAKSLPIRESEMGVI